MERRRLRRPSPALVVACLALLMALGGTGYAAIKLPRNSVTSVQVKDRSLLAKDFKPGQLPAGPPGPAGPAGAAGAAARWVEVLPGGGIVGQSGGISVTRVGNGYYVVNFGVDVTGKAIIASAARSSEDRGGHGTVVAGPCTTSSQAGDNCATGNDPRFVGVYTYHPSNGEPENHAFYVALLG